MTLTNLSDEARKKGLEKARLVRKKRSEIKEQLKKGKTSINKLFKDQELFENYIAGMMYTAGATLDPLLIRIISSIVIFIVVLYYAMIRED